MPIEDKCKQCLDEDSHKRFYTAECGTIQDWMDRIEADTTKDALIATWTILMTTRWDRKEQQKLGFAYVKRLANIVSKEYWAKPIQQPKAQSLFAALKALQSTKA